MMELFPEASEFAVAGSFSHKQEHPPEPCGHQGLSPYNPASSGLLAFARGP